MVYLRIAHRICRVPPLPPPPSRRPHLQIALGLTRSMHPSFSNITTTFPSPSRHQSILLCITHPTLHQRPASGMSHPPLPIDVTPLIACVLGTCRSPVATLNFAYGARTSYPGVTGLNK